VGSKLLFIFILMLSWARLSLATDDGNREVAIEVCKTRIAILGQRSEAPKSINPTLQKLMNLTGDRVGWALANRYSFARDLRIRKLQTEVSELLPPEVSQFMAMMPQVSYSYLLDDLPALDSVQRKSEAELKGSIDWEHRYAHQEEWTQRIGDARKKLVEILELQKLNDSKEDKLNLALTRLSLAILYSFSYGFEDSVDKGLPPWVTNFNPGSDGNFVEAATQNYLEALKELEESFPKNSIPVAFTKFLLGKHALNGLQAFSNAGRYTFGGRKIPPLPRAYEYLGLSREMLSSVIENFSPIVKNRMIPFGKVHEVYFESLYQLSELGRWEGMLKFPQMTDGDISRVKDAAQKALVELFMTAPSEWVLKNVRTHHGLIDRLLGQTLWDYSLDRSKRDRINSLTDKRAANYSYQDIVRILIDDVDLVELKPLLPKLLN
jgi:hypothetical protein